MEEDDLNNLLVSIIRLVRYRGYIPAKENFFARLLDEVERKEYKIERGLEYNEPNYERCILEMQDNMSRKYGVVFGRDLKRTRMSYVFDKDNSDEKLFVFISDEESAKKKDNELFSNYLIQLGDGKVDPNMHAIFVYKTKISTNTSNFLSLNRSITPISDQQLLNEPLSHFLQSSVKCLNKIQAFDYARENNVNFKLFPSIGKSNILPLCLGLKKDDLIVSEHNSMIEQDSMPVSFSYRTVKN